MARDIVLVGCGNMGFAMLKGWVSDHPELRFHVVEPVADLQARAEAIGGKIYGSVDELPTNLREPYVFLAVKPQVMDKVAPAYAVFPDAVFISVAAGITCGSLHQWLGDEAAIVRTMPNTPAAIGEGMLVSYANPSVGQSDRDAIDELLSACGQTGWIADETLMDAVTAISGSGPAYVFHFIECLASAGEALGLDAELSLKLALQTTAGAGLLARGSEISPDVLRQQVTSPGGTTAAALDVLMGAMQPIMTKAATAARDRGVELGKGS